MDKTIHDILEALGIRGSYVELGRRLMARIDVPLVAVQAGLIVVVGLLGIWFMPRIKHLVSHIIALATPKTWQHSLDRAFGSVTAPLFWLVTLWLALALARALGFEFRLVAAAVSLLAAWVTIRLLSFAVRNPILSAAISVTAWSIAALSILGLLHPLAQELDSMAFMLGRLRISALLVVRALFILVLLLWGTSLLSQYLERRITGAETLTPSLQVLLVRVLNLALPVVAVVIAMSAVGIDLTALTVLSGAIGIGVGLGLQRTVANLIAGLTLVLGKSIKPGDVVAYKNGYGWVTSMGARFVTIATRDGSEYLVPNEEFITNGVENWSYSNELRRLHIPFGVAYESDMHEVIRICLEAVKSVDRIVRQPEPVCLMTEYGDSSVNFEIRAWIRDPKNGIANVKSAVLLAIWDAFKAHGITIPFPQRDVHLIPMPGEGRTVSGAPGP
jgi:small-conductance mechanosensitive channel